MDLMEWFILLIWFIMICDVRIVRGAVTCNDVFSLAVDTTYTGSSSCYYGFLPNKQYPDAKTLCESGGAHLLFLETTAETTALASGMPNDYSQAWLGLEKLSGTWKWVDDSTETVASPLEFNTDVGSNERAVISGWYSIANSIWLSTTAADWYKTICEKDAASTTSAKTTVASSSTESTTQTSTQAATVFSTTTEPTTQTSTQATTVSSTTESTIQTSTQAATVSSTTTEPTTQTSTQAATVSSTTTEPTTQTSTQPTVVSSSTGSTTQTMIELKIGIFFKRTDPKDTYIVKAEVSAYSVIDCARICRRSSGCDAIIYVFADRLCKLRELSAPSSVFDSCVKTEAFACYDRL